MSGKKRPIARSIFRGVRSFEGKTLFLAVLAILVAGPLRDVLDGLPGLVFLGTLALFMVPGALLTRWLAGPYVTAGVLLPLAFVLSASVFGVLGVPFLLMGQGIEAYLWASGVLLACFLLTATIKALYSGSSAGGQEPDRRGLLEWLLWALFLGFSAVLAFVSRLRTPDVYEDIWVYVAWVREFAGAKSLARYEPYLGERIEGLSRAKINGWLLEQAAMARVSGLDPVAFVLDYLTPALVVVALFSFYALARILLKSEVGALVTGSACALFFMAYLSPSVHVFGGELIGRAAEDKLLARFAFLPVALIFTFLFLETRRRRYLALFGLVVWAVAAVHPIGLAVIGLSVGSFCLFYLLMNLRQRKAWMGAAAVGAVLGSVLVPPALLLLAGEGSAAALYSADINSGDPRVLANMVFVRPEWRHIYEVGGGYYIMHPYLLLTPAIAAAYLLGLPFLARRLRGSLAAQMLFGIMVVVTLLVYVPPVATFFGNAVIIPGQLWRMAWPIPLAALITLGWLLWRAAVFASKCAKRSGVAARIAGYSPLFLVLLLALIVAPLAVSGVRAVQTASEPEVAAGYPADPIFPWMSQNLRGPGIMLAPDAENTVIPAYSSSIDVISLRDGAVLDNLPAIEQRLGEEIEPPRRAVDVRKFYSRPSVEEAFGILRRYGVDYVLVYRNSPLDEQLREMPAFGRIEAPGEHYSLFAVEPGKL